LPFRRAEPVDFRKGIDSLAGVCRQQFQVDPFLGALFVFRNRAGTALNLLVHDGQRFWLCQNQPSSHCTSFNVS
jgi:transposase